MPKFIIHAVATVGAYREIKAENADDALNWALAHPQMLDVGGIHGLDPKEGWVLEDAKLRPDSFRVSGKVVDK